MLPGFWKYENSWLGSFGLLMHRSNTTEFVKKEHYLVVVSVQKYSILVLTRGIQTEAVSFKLPIFKCRF